MPILGGGRLTGKVGDFSVGAINIQTDDTSAADAASTNFSVLRIKRDILRRSRVGAIFTNRSVSVEGDGANQAYGLDGSFSFHDNLNLYGYYARTNTPAWRETTRAIRPRSPTRAISTASRRSSARGQPLQPRDRLHAPRRFRRSYVYTQFSPRPRGLAAVRQFTWSGSLDYIENGAGQLETRILSGRFQTSFENSDSLSADIQQDYELLTEPFEITGDVTLPVGGYEFRDFQVSYRMGPQRRLAGNLSLQHGEFFDGDITAVGYSRGRIEVTRQFAIEPSVSLNRITLPQGAFTARVAATRLTYTFTPRMFASALLQYNSTNNVLSTNVRLRWEYQPGSELFVVYNDQRDTWLNRGFPMLENRAFVVKLTRSSASEPSAVRTARRPQNAEPPARSANPPRGFEERFGLLVDAEWTAREQRKLQRRLRAAKLRHPATLEAVDFVLPSVAGDPAPPSTPCPALDRGKSIGADAPSHPHSVPVQRVS